MKGARVHAWLVAEPGPFLRCPDKLTLRGDTRRSPGPCCVGAMWCLVRTAPVSL